MLLVILASFCLFGMTASAEDVRLEFVLADSKYRPSPYDDDGNLVEGYKAGTYFNDMGLDYDYLNSEGALLDGVAFELKYWVAGGGTGYWDAEYMTCIAGVSDSLGNPVDHGKLVFYLPNDVVRWQLRVDRDTEGFDISHFCWFDDNGFMEMTDSGGWFPDGLTPDDYSGHVNSSLSWSVDEYGTWANRSWDDSLDASFGVVPVWKPYSGIQTYGGASDSVVKSYSGSVLFLGRTDSNDDDTVELKFIKADSKGKPEGSFADGSRIEDAVTEGDMFEELGTEGPSYDWLDEHGFLIDGCLFSLTYNYKDDDGKSVTGFQACWSGGVQPDEWLDVWQNYKHWDYETKTYVYWKDSIVSYNGINPGEVIFRLPPSTTSWTLSELWCPEKYADGSFGYYNDEGGLDSHSSYGVPGVLKGSRSDIDEPWDTHMSMFYSDGEVRLVYKDPNPGYGGVRTYASHDEEWVSYTGYILWNDEKVKPLQFIKADSKDKPKGSFADGSYYDDNGAFIDGIAWYQLDTLINGALFEVRYGYRDADNKYHGETQYCWSGGMPPDDWSEHMYGSDYTYYKDRAACREGLSPGELYFEIPYAVSSVSLYEVVTPNGYEKGSFMKYVDAGVIDLWYLEYPCGFTCTWDDENRSWTKMWSYEYGWWNSPDDVHLVETNPWYMGVSTYDNSDPDGSVVYPYTGDILWNDAIDSDMKLEFIKADSRYRPSPYDSDGNVVSGYKVGTFNDCDVVLDYEYLKALDDKYGDVLINGVCFTLSYRTDSGYLGSVSCWAGGVDNRGHAIWDGVDVKGNALEKGRVAFYVPQNTVWWSLSESSEPIDYVSMDNRSYHCIGTYDDTGYWTAFDRYRNYLYGQLQDDGSWSVTMNGSESGSKQHVLYGDDPVDDKKWNSVSATYTGNIIWNDKNPIFSKTPVSVMNDKSPMNLKSEVPGWVYYSKYNDVNEYSIVMHDVMDEGMSMSGEPTARVDVYDSSSKSFESRGVLLGDAGSDCLVFVEDPDDGCSFHIVSGNMFEPYANGIVPDSGLSLRNDTDDGYVSFQSGSVIDVAYDVTLDEGVSYAENTAWMTLNYDGVEYNSVPVKSRMRSNSVAGLTIRKTDDGGNDLSGAEFIIERLMGDGGFEEHDKWTRYGMLDSEDGISFSIEGLETGMYRIVESKAPDGFTVMDPVCFYLTVDNGTIDIQYESVGWCQSDGGFVFWPDELAESFDGYYLTDTNEKVYMNQLSASDSSAVPYGGGCVCIIACFKDTESHSNVTSTSIDDGNINLAVANHKTAMVMMPETGGTGIVPVTAFGFVLVALGIYLVRKKK
ncbi:MAG: LPXTG cell wall anchor domain-containing protein [Clostridia bacterium]|nr:LPXTG cell wall anchor domain-containing protein [Clostridia bacterium]